MTEPPLPEESIFAQALEITSAAERAAFLDRSCGNNLALRTEVEGLGEERFFRQRRLSHGCDSRPANGDEASAS